MNPANQPKVVGTSPAVVAPPLRLPPKNHYRFRACDLFAGAGGLSKGLEDAGYEVVCANELDSVACATYRANHKDTVLIEGDIRLEETKAAICACFTDKPCDLLAAGVCCQSWSATGKRKGFSDERGLLWFHFFAMVQRLKPRMVVAENVPGLANHPEALKVIHSLFNHLGYHAEHRVLSAADYGTPQKRKRLFLIATRIDFRNAPITWPHPQFAPAAKKGSPQ